MIIRILSEGQYEISDDFLTEITALDEKLLAAIIAEDKGAFHQDFTELLKIARSGKPVDDSFMGESDLVLPPADISFEEAQKMFRDHSF